MPLQCPHCQSTIVIEGKPPGEVVCPSCGSSIQLDPAATTGYLPEHAPKRLGKFEFLEQLGVGAFGTVYKARDTELDRIVAVKVPRGAAGLNPAARDDLDRFLREAKSAAQLKHPSIASLYDAGTIDGTCCLVSEFIHGATLAQYLSAKRLSFRQAAELIAEVADALHYAHQRGVVHRDVKPSNIMLDLEGRPHLMDFGLAKRAADEITMTLEGQVLGTPAYMSPEQARGEARRVDSRSDIYSLGVILYELLTGELPFRGQTRMLLVQVIQDEPRPPRRLNDQISRDLETICLKAMAKEPARRYATARDLADDLRRWLKGEPIQARPVGRIEKAWRWCRRNPARAALVACALLLLASGVAAGFWYQHVRADRLRQSVQAERDIVAALQESEALLKQAETFTDNPYHWEATLAAAFSVLKRAEAFADRTGGPLDGALTEHMQAVRTRLEEEEKDRQMVATLTRIRMERAEKKAGENRFAFEDAGPKFREAFARYGMAVSLPPADVAARIRDRRAPIQAALVSGLDVWTHMPGVPKSDRDWLHAVLAAADNDPWRSQVRDADFRRDRAALEALSLRDETLELPPATLEMLARLLGSVQGDESGIRVLHRAQERYPADFWISHDLAIALLHSKPSRPDEAISYFRVALALQPQNAGVHLNLGTALTDKKDLPGAIAEYRKAIAIDPQYTAAHYCLGNALRIKGDLPAAIAAHQEAIKLDPKNPEFYSNLGAAYYDNGDAANALATFRKGLEVFPPNSVPFALHYNVGKCLYSMGDLPGAIAEFQTEIALNPKFATAYYVLGNALREKGDVAGAIAACQKAIELDPQNAEAHVNLGSALQVKGDLPGAIAEFQRAMELNPNLPQAHCSLGLALTDQGEFTRALVHLRRGHELGSKTKGWGHGHESARWVQQCEPLAELEQKLPAVLRGEAKPASPAERIEYAKICALKQLYGTSARFYAEAFNEQPGLGNQHRFRAIRSAARAGCGQGQELDTSGQTVPARLDEGERARWRQQALNWSQVDLAAGVKMLDSGKPEDRTLVRRALQLTQTDRDTACLRDAAELAKLPEAEREAWTKFWADVADVIQRAEKGP